MEKFRIFVLGKRSIKVIAGDSAFLEDLVNLLEPFHAGARKRAGLSLRAVIPPDERGARSVSYRLLRAGQEVFKSPEPFRLLYHLEWMIIRYLLQGSEFLQFHSGAVARGGRAVLFPAGQDSGKTTLTVALSQNGFRILSDEVALIHPRSLLVHGFPRNIYLDPTMKDLFSRLGYPLKFRKMRWIETSGANLYPRGRKPVPREGSCRVAMILFPRYSPRHKNRLHLLSGGEALIRLMENAINFNLFHGRGIDIAEGLVKGADCYALEVGDLSGAVDLIRDLFDSRREGGRG